MPVSILAETFDEASAQAAPSMPMIPCPTTEVVPRTQGRNPRRHSQLQVRNVGSEVVGEKSPLHSLTRILANKRRNLVRTPVNNNYLELWPRRSRYRLSMMATKSRASILLAVLYDVICLVVVVYVVYSKHLAGWWLLLALAVGFLAVKSLVRAARAITDLSPPRSQT